MSLLAGVTRLLVSLIVRCVLPYGGEGQRVACSEVSCLSPSPSVRAGRAQQQAAEAGPLVVVGGGGSGAAACRAAGDGPHGPLSADGRRV